MKVQQVEGESLPYLAIEPDDYRTDESYPLVIMIHGYASTMQEVASLAPMIGQDGYVFVCPGGPISFRVRSGRIAYGWSSPGSTQEEVEEEEEEAEQRLASFFFEVLKRYQVGPRRTLLMGFSQGGSLSLRCGLPRPETFAGLASLSGYLPEVSALQRRLPTERSQQIFVAHGVNDQYIPLQKARDMKAFLESECYSPSYHEYPMRHEVGQDVISDLAPWIRSVLPPATHR